MATVTIAPREIEVTLTLSKDEALYIYSALNRVDPDEASAPFSEDPVYDVLGDALRDAGVDTISVLRYAEVR